MRIGICTFLAMALTGVIQAQVLEGDQRFPVVNKIQWDMNRQGILDLCAANNINAGGNDSAVTFDSHFFDTPAKVVTRFRKNTGVIWIVEIRFQKRPEHLPDTLINYFTRKLGKEPARVEQEKSVLLFTLKMEVSVWKTAKERITVMLAKQNKSIFEISLMLGPVNK